MYPWVLPATHCLPACLPVVLAQLAGHFYPAYNPLQQTYSPPPVLCLPTSAVCAGLVCVVLCARVRVVQSDAGKAWYVTRSRRPTSAYTSTTAVTVRSQ